MNSRVSAFLVFFFITASFAVFGDPKESLKIDSLQRELEKAKQDTQRIKLLNQLSYELRKSDTAKARKLALEAMKLSEKDSYFLGQAQSHISLSEYYRTRGNREEALANLFEAIDISTEHNYKKELLKAYNKVGVIYQGVGDYEEALIYFNKSLPVSIELKEDEATAGIFNNIGVINFLHGDYSGALENYISSIKIREKLGDKAGIAASYNNIANIFSEQHKYEQALSYYLKGVDIRKQVNDLKGLANTYGNIGALYYQMNNDKKAMVFYEEALELSLKIDDQAMAALNYINIGKIYLDEENHAEAVRNFSAARQIYQKSGDKRGLATTASAIGALYIKRKNYNLAVSHLKEALSLAKEINLKEEIQNVYFKLATAGEGMGDYKMSSEYFRLYISMRDSITNEVSDKMVAELEAKYRTNKKQKEIELLKTQKEAQEAILEKNELVIYSSFAVIILSLGLVFFIYRTNVNNKKANSKLIEQNRKILQQKEEKEVLLKEVHHRVKNNLQVINSLLNIQSAYIDDDRFSALFVDCQNRVRSMSLIHEQLYSSPDLNKVDLKSYIEILTRDILRSYNLNSDITLDIKLSVQTFGVNTLIPVGLILNELFSNSLKHAFGDTDSGMIMIHLQSVGDEKYEMIIGDNGRGIKDSDFLETNNTLGLELVRTFVKQLDGSIERLNVPGTVFKIIFRDITPSSEKMKLRFSDPQPN